MRSLRIAMAQINPTVGDIDGNTALIKAWIKEARRAKPDIVAFPELAITGYPPEDLLFKARFIDDTQRALKAITAEAHGLVVVVGYVGREGTGVTASEAAAMPSAGRHDLYNAAAVLAERRIVANYCKRHLPNYGVFDESRYFHPGTRLPLLILNGTTIGVNICEDIWYPEGPSRAQAAAGAEVIVNINASPFHVGKSRVREQVLATRARENRVFVTYTNTVGGQDELVFDGCSVIVDQTGEIVARGKAFAQDLLVADLDVAAVGRARQGEGRKKPVPPRVAALIDRVEVRVPARKSSSTVVPPLGLPLERVDEAYRALVLGVQDYVLKNGFRRVVIGLSGGVDSALTAVIAVDALGADNVLGVFMPSPYTSRASREDVADLARRLRIQVETLSITTTFKSYLRTLSKPFAGSRPDTTEENLQARIRGNLLMAYSNKFGHLVLTTGNKSEMSVGYATLYGDMAGGFAVIKDVPKTMVYELSHLRNLVGPEPVIPKRVLERAPTAELRPDQKDEDSLPPYSILDPILKAYVEEDRALEDIVAMGFDRETVARVMVMVDRSEYKRRQAPLGIKITHRAFGKDRRMPITNGYR
ncbi:MAG: NAD+ synthase [Nitrospira sp.]|uniref:Glutamine-dependent NAD(+) synthetase n=1 Tax=Nitrospira defluvii TaxID=330214 RepID=A0ABM8R7Z6_9BACT|nr:NAD+ synthase [Nitrospira defluvii]MCS6326296.1 NAD+ synthase [Nitrospira sp.]CAE6737794.1 Glutamine-dependent NAD(+) synthetase [Nitrospira defluvii]